MVIESLLPVCSNSNPQQFTIHRVSEEDSADIFADDMDFMHSQNDIHVRLYWHVMNVMLYQNDVDLMFYQNDMDVMLYRMSCFNRMTSMPCSTSLACSFVCEVKKIKIQTNR